MHRDEMSSSDPASAKSRIICDGLRVSVAAVTRTRKVNYFEYKQNGHPACSLGTARFLCYNRPNKSRSL
jgi:hypothetical protein